MQSSTEGTPAAGERLVPEWQYWQSTWYRPAWCLWLNGIGWTGPGVLGSSAAACERQAARVGHGTSKLGGISIESDGSSALRALSSWASHTLVATSVGCATARSPTRPATASAMPSEAAKIGAARRMRRGGRVGLMRPRGSPDVRSRVEDRGSEEEEGPRAGAFAAARRLPAPNPRGGIPEMRGGVNPAPGPSRAARAASARLDAGLEIVNDSETFSERGGA